MNHFHKLLLCTFYITSASAGVIPLFNPNDIAKSNTFTVTTNTLLVNDPFTLKDLFSGLEGDFHAKDGMNYAFGITRNDFGYTIENFGYIGYAYREEIYMKAQESTLELLYLANNKKDLQTGKVYNFYLAIEAYEMHSFVYASSLSLYKTSHTNIRLGVSTELLVAYDMQSGYVDGYVVATSPNDYAYEGLSNYQYTHNYLYDLSVKSPHGYGYTTHLCLDATFDSFHFSFVANDLYGKIYWEDLPYSDVYFSSQNKSYDDGYAHYAPLLSGQEGYTNYTQTLVQKFRVQGSYKTQKNLYTLGSDYLYETALPYVDYTHFFSEDFSMGVGYGSRFDTVKLALSYKNFHIQTRFDDIIHPFALGCELGYSHRF